MASGRLLIALVTKIRSPQTTGLECASPGMGVRHRMFSPVLPFQRSGRCCPSATPDACGPRKDGQLPLADVACGSVRRTRRAPGAQWLVRPRPPAAPSGRHVLSFRTMRLGTQSSERSASDRRMFSTRNRYRPGCAHSCGPPVVVRVTSSCSTVHAPLNGGHSFPTIVNDAIGREPYGERAVLERGRRQLRCRLLCDDRDGRGTHDRGDQPGHCPREDGASWCADANSHVPGRSMDSCVFA